MIKLVKTQTGPFVEFRNKGTLDPRSITTFGVSSKENAGAIGFFGTGLKYAVAILLREGCTIDIRSGGNHYAFGHRRETIRVDEFDLVTMNGEPIGFTTELGKTWQVWQALRELYCNCMDEGGTAELVSNPGPHNPEDTVVTVSGRPFVGVWHDRGEIFVESPIEAELPGMLVRRGASKYLYYKGIRIGTLPTPSLYTYDLQGSLDLTEDRTVKYDWQARGRIASALCKLTDKAIITRVATAEPMKTFESTLGFSGDSPSEEIVTVVRDLSRAFCKNLNESLRGACKTFVSDALDHASAMPLDTTETVRLERAVAFCKGIGFQVDKYPILAVEFIGEHTLAQAHDDKIYVTKRIFMQGTKMLATALIEEFLHLEQKLKDETRDMQNYLFEVIVSLGERVTGQVL